MNKQLKYIIIMLGLLNLVSCSSCEPDPINEGITLPQMEFAFKVYPDTSYIKVGDTFTLYAAMSSITSNGIKLDDGEGELWFGIVKGENIPRISYQDIKSALNNEDYHLIVRKGGVKWVQSNPNELLRLTAFPLGDSIIMHYELIFLKKGLFQIGGFQSSFYEGSKGKGRWNAYFDVKDPNWSFFQVPNETIPTPNDDYYNRHFFVAVTD